MGMSNVGKIWKELKVTMIFRWSVEGEDNRNNAVGRGIGIYSGGWEMF